MTGDYKFRFMPGILYSMFTLLLLSGCIAENNDDCFKGVPLKVKLPAGISQETIKDMSLYVFDDKDLLLDILPVNSTEPVNLNYPGIPTLHCVALCNTQDGTMLVSPPEKGRFMLRRFHISETLCAYKGREEHIHPSGRFILRRAYNRKYFDVRPYRGTGFGCFTDGSVNEYNRTRSGTS